MDPKQVVEDRVAAIERGEITNAVVPTDKTNTPPDGKKIVGRKGYHNYPIADESVDHLRGYKPGEKTTKDLIALVLGIMLDEGRPMLQSKIVDRAAELMDRPRPVATTRVSASLLWLRVTGVVLAGKKTTGRGGQIWITTQTIKDIIERGEGKLVPVEDVDERQAA